MRGYELRHALRAGTPVFGICLEGYGQPRWPRYLAQMGMDFVFLENEHTPLNRETMAWAAQAYAAHGVAPLIRIPEVTASWAAIGMDLGAHGIIAPYVETVAQVRDLVGAVKYRPLKGAALQLVLQEGRFPSPEMPAYLETFNRDAVLVIMIESPAGVAALPDLLAVQGVDGVLVGPHDFSVSHGVPEQYDHPVFRNALRRMIGICQAHGVSVGVHLVAGELERELEWAAWGCSLFVHRSDTAFIADGTRRELAQLRHSLDCRREIASSELSVSQSQLLDGTT